MDIRSDAWLCQATIISSLCFKSCTRGRFDNRFAINADTAKTYTNSNRGAHTVGVGPGAEGNVYEPGYLCTEGEGKGPLVSASFSCLGMHLVIQFLSARPFL